MITWESRHRVMYKAARASVTDTSIEVRRFTTAVVVPTKPAIRRIFKTIRGSISPQPRRSDLIGTNVSQPVHIRVSGDTK